MSCLPPGLRWCGSGDTLQQPPNSCTHLPAGNLDVVYKGCKELHSLDGSAGTLGAGDQAVKQLLAYQVTW